MARQDPPLKATAVRSKGSSNGRTDVCVLQSFEKVGIKLKLVRYIKNRANAELPVELRSTEQPPSRGPSSRGSRATRASRATRDNAGTDEEKDGGAELAAAGEDGAAAADDATRKLKEKQEQDNLDRYLERSLRASGDDGGAVAAAAAGGAGRRSRGQRSRGSRGSRESPSRESRNSRRPSN